MRTPLLVPQIRESPKGTREIPQLRRERKVLEGTYELGSIRQSDIMSLYSSPLGELITSSAAG